MNQKFHFRWLLSAILCCVAFIAQAATVNISNCTATVQYSGYPLFVGVPSTITVSSSNGSFDSVYIDDIQVAYNNDSYWSSHTVNIAVYMDGKPHKLQIEGGSSDYGICYFLSGEGTDLYYIIEDASATLVGSVRSIENATILDEYEYEGVKYPVTKIADKAFYGCKKLQSVTIPNSIKTIGNETFYNCTALTSVTIPESVTSIGERAFSGCTALTTLAFNAENCTSSYPYDSVFPSSISKLTFGDKVKTIPAYLLYNGSQIESLTIPNSVTTIGDYAFYNSKQLKSLTLGSGLLSIGNHAFSYIGGPNIAKAFWLGNTPPANFSAIHASINYVANDQYSFSEQKKYQFLSSKFEVNGTIYVPVSPSERTCDVIDCDYSLQNGEIVISDKVVNRGVELKVLNINDYSFYENQTVTSLVVGNNGNIGNSAFYDCNSLLNASINNVGSIGNQAFYNCEAMNNVTLGNSITTIGDKVFYSCSSLPAVAIPDNVSAIGEYVFYGCSKLATVNLGTGITAIQQYSFANCSMLNNVTIPNNVKSIADYVFSGCSTLANLTLEDSERDGNVSDTPTTQTFEDWTSTNRSDGSTSCKEYAIKVVAGDKLSFNYSVDSEPGCDYLTIKLNGVEIVKESGNKSDGYSKTFTESGNVTLYLSYTKDSSRSSGQDKASVYNIALNGKSFIIDNLKLGSNGSEPLFADCPLDKVYIGRKLSYNIWSNCGYSPFYRNTSLRSVEITDAETQIYDNEFYGCSNLNTLKIGNGVKNIGKWAFSGCSSLDYFSAGFNVESIGEEAFSDCTGLKKYYSYSVVPPVCGTQALDDINKWDCTLYVPANSADEYSSADQWKDFFFVEEMDAVLVAEIRLNLSEVEIGVGEQKLLTAEVIPANATNKELNWASTNPDIVTVDKDGLLTAHAVGEATITVSSADGNAQTNCLVTVVPSAGIENVGIDDIDSKIEYFNLNGVPVSPEYLTPGVNIRKQGNKVEKIIVK